MSWSLSAPCGNPRVLTHVGAIAQSEAKEQGRARRTPACRSHPKCCAPPSITPSSAPGGTTWWRRRRRDDGGCGNAVTVVVEWLSGGCRAIVGWLRRGAVQKTGIIQVFGAPRDRPNGAFPPPVGTRVRARVPGTPPPCRDFAARDSTRHIVSPRPPACPTRQFDCRPPSLSGVRRLVRVAGSRPSPPGSRVARPLLLKSKPGRVR